MTGTLDRNRAGDRPLPRRRGLSRARRDPQADAEELKKRGPTGSHDRRHQGRLVADAKQTVEEEPLADGLVRARQQRRRGRRGRSWPPGLDDLRSTLEVNLVEQVAVRERSSLIRKAKGTIIFIASIGGRVASPFMSPYNCTEFGIEGLGESCATSCSPGTSTSWWSSRARSTPRSPGARARRRCATGWRECLKQARRLYGRQMAHAGR